MQIYEPLAEEDEVLQSAQYSPNISVIWQFCQGSNPCYAGIKQLLESFIHKYVCWVSNFLRSQLQPEQQ